MPIMSLEVSLGELESTLRN